MDNKAEDQIYEHGRFKVAGGILPNAITAYRAYGNAANPCVVFPTCYGAKMRLGSECDICFAEMNDNETEACLRKGQDYLVGEGKVRCNNEVFIV